MVEELASVIPGRRLPAAMREVPDSWWDKLLNGQRWYIRMEDFEVKATTLPNIRLFAYRRADARSLFVSSTITTRPRRLYLWATREPRYRAPVNWSDALPAPPMDMIDANLGRVASEEFLRAAIVSLRSLGYQVTPPEHQLVESPELPMPQARSTRDILFSQPVPPGWTRSQYTGQLLPPGVPDIEGAVYEDDESPEDIREGAAEFALIKARCTCGTADLRTHDVACAAWVA